MASRRGLKRKSNDFIYEIDEHDLSSDENNCGDSETPTKFQKLDSNDSQSSKPQTSASTRPNLQIRASSSSEVLEDTAISSVSKLEIKSTDTVGSVSTDDLAASEFKHPEVNSGCHQEHLKNSDEMKVKKSSSGDSLLDIYKIDGGIIELDDSDANDSVEILPNETIPVMEITDDDIDRVSHEDGEVLEVFEIVDEVGPSPRRAENTENISEAVMDISFRSEDVKALYENEIIAFLATFPEFEISSNELCIHVSRSSEKPVVQMKKAHVDSLIQKTPKKKHKKKKAKKELFILDTNPSVNDLKSLDVRYSSKFTIEEENKEQAEEKSKVPQLQTCFNCSQNHALKDCQLPRDYNRINSARQKFTSNKSKLTRYHVDEEQKFAHLKPGVISADLRRALGLRKNELPSYIYGMRAMGYPPGWLEEAKIVHSSLNMFDIDGGKVKRVKKKKKGLDPDKIVEYPGFNAPIGKGFHDEFKKYNVPPYKKNLEKKFMLKHFEEICGEESNSDMSDMDLDEGVERIETSKSNIGLEVVEKDAPSTTLSSLTELEKQKKELINQLNESSLNLLKEETNKKRENEKSDKNDSDAVSAIAVRSTALGTPILKSSSPYSRLPNADNFMVGVSPVIDFENLPNSTGKYEQMSGVLNKVRTTLKNLEGCKS